MLKEQQKTSTTEPSPETSAEFRLFLQSEFLNRCRKNQRYSLSAFARLLGIDVSTLAKILKGQRPIRAQAIRKLGAKLGLDPVQIQKFEKASPRANAKNKKSADAVDSNYQQLTLDAFQVISDWYHYAILELARLPHFKNDPTWIAKALRITPAEVQIAIERLHRLEMIDIRDDGTWADLSGGYSTTLGHQFTASAFRKMQKQLLEKAITALDEVPFERRTQQSMTMAVNANKIEEARKMITDFQRKLNQFLNQGESKNLTEVYNLNISLYPVSFTKKEGSV